MSIGTIVGIVLMVVIVVGGYFWVKSGWTGTIDKSAPPSDAGPSGPRGGGPGK